MQKNASTNPIPIQELVQSQAVNGQALQSALDRYGPTVRIDGLLEITCVSRSKAYELMQVDHTFPQGVPLYDGENSPRFYWTHEALAWVEARSNKFRNQLEVTNHE